MKVEERKCKNDTFESAKAGRASHISISKTKILHNQSPPNETKLHKISEVKENKPNVIKQTTK